MSKWTPVSEKWPRVKKNGFSKYVIVLLGGSQVSEGRIRNNTEWRDCMERRIRPTHWMPLPPVTDTEEQNG